MKKIILSLCLIAFTFNAVGQQIWMSAYKVDPSNTKQAREAIAEKTKTFNTLESERLIYTYEIVAGERANYLVRVGFGESLAQLDSWDNAGYDYWIENVSPLISNVGGTEYMQHATDASFDDAVAGSNRISKVLHYNVKRNGGPDFWNFRTRVAKAAEKVGNISLNVWTGSLGGPNGHVIVGYASKDMSGIDNETETWPKVIEAYKELFGEESFKTDQKAFNESLNAWGNYSEIWRWLPELSSPPVPIQE